MKKILVLFSLLAVCNLQAGILTLTNSHLETIQFGFSPDGVEKFNGSPNPLVSSGVGTVEFVPSGWIWVFDASEDEEYFWNAPSTDADYTAIYVGGDSSPVWNAVPIPEPTAEMFMIYATGVMVAYCVTRPLQRA